MEKEHFEHRRTLKADLEYRENQKRIGKKRATKETALNHIKNMRKGLTD